MSPTPGVDVYIDDEPENVIRPPESLSASEKGAPGGVATLDVDGHVPLSELPLRRRLVAGGNLGATPSLAMQATDQDVWLVGALNANATLTLTGLAAGQSVRLLLTQDATGGRTLSIAVGASTAAVAVNAGANATSVVSCFYDGTDLYVRGV